MDNCSSIKESLSTVVDGCASSEVEKKIVDHLKQCPNCQQEFDDLKELKNNIASLSKITTNSDFDEKLWQRIKLEKNKSKIIDFTAKNTKRNFSRFFNSTIVYAAGVAVAVIGFIAIDKSEVFNFDDSKIAPVIKTNNMMAKNKENDSLQGKNSSDTLKVMKNIHKSEDDMIHRVSDEIDN